MPAAFVLAFLALQTTPPQVQEKDPPPPAQVPASKSGLSFYPMPAIGSDKNSGVTYGILGAIMFTNEEGIQDGLLATTVAHQPLAGWSGETDFRYYPTLTGVLDLDAYLAQKVESSLRLYYEEYRLAEDYHLRLEYLDQRMAAERFFGRGGSTPHENESALTANEYRAEARFGPRLSKHWDVEGTARWRHFRVGDSLIKDLPQMKASFPDEPGIEGGQAVASGVRFVGDSRSSLTTPTSGTSVVLYFESAWNFTAARADQYWTFGASQTSLWPMDADRQFVTVLNTSVQGAVGDTIPFWELPTLGGSNTLRSFNGGRFRNNYALLINLEERIRVYRTSLFGVSGEVQVAPFFDLGKVFDSGDELVGRGVFRFYHYSTGIGFRGVVPPSFVGRLDIAFGGREGVGITIGLDYPF
jgi:hypothetical protein